MTWRELDARREIVASGLLELGVEPGARVNILANTSIHWMLADLGVLSIGAETVPIYQSSLASECAFIIENCGGSVVFAENRGQLDKLLEQRPKLGSVRKVVVMSGETDGTDWTIGWEELVAKGQAALEKNRPVIAERSGALTEESILTLIYTSGTTGQPKGVILTHDNIMSVSQAALDIELISHEDIELLFLPMAHVFAKLLEVVWIMAGHEMVIDPEVTRITANMAEVRPTLMASVPRIFEKVYAKVVSGGLEPGGVKAKLFRWALDVNDRYAQAKIDRRPVPAGLELQRKLARKLVFSKVHAKLSATFGGRLKFFISGGAPLPKKMAFFFSAADVTILEGYGLTETSAATCVNRPGRNVIGSVGSPLPGNEVKIADDGEILIKGPGVMKGYWNRPEATAEVLLPGGWFATGDIGEIDGDGNVIITDRKKDIIVTAGGKNIAPQNIENAVKSANPLISQVVVHGDKRKFLVALITLEPEAAKKLAADHGVEGDYAAICRSEVARTAIQDTIDRVNAQLARFETIKAFKILEKDFEIGHELTHTLKVKRKVCMKKYGEILDAFYDERVE